MNSKLRAYANVALVTMAVLMPSFATAQDGFIRQDQLQELCNELSEISTRGQSSVDETMTSMAKLEDYSGDEQTAQAFAMLDTIDAETREVIDKIKITSPFVSALDDARATVLVLLRKERRDPPGASRDARIEALTNSLASIDEQSAQIMAVEGRLIILLGETIQRRCELLGGY